MIELILQVLFPIFIILYWFSEGVSEGWTWANKTRQKKNKLICLHMGKGHAGMFDYHAWRIFENLGIWGTVIIGFLMGGYDVSFKKFFFLGLGAWLIGTCLYEFALNYVNKNTIWKPIDFKWHILGYDIPWWGGKRVLALPVAGLLVLIYGILI
tara:strand:- start:34 stop:495 length:462 start_codon:yes stop_codon:yes gene_type:complete